MSFNNKHNFSWMRILSVPTLIVLIVVIGIFALLPLVIDFQWEDTFLRLSDINVWVYVVAMFSYFASFVFRGIRWRLLAENTGELELGNQITPSIFQSSMFILLGWFVNSVAWMRIGDAYRAYLFARKSRTEISWSLGILLAERVLDTMVVFGILAISFLFLIWQRSSTDYQLLKYIFSIAFLMTLFLIMVLILMRFFRNFIQTRLPSKIKQFYFQFQKGALSSFKKIYLLVLLSCIGWLLEIMRLYFVVVSLGFEVPLILIPIVALSHALLSVVPTPGGIGAVEAGTIGILLIALSNADAISVVLLDRSITFLAVIIVGAIVFVIRNFYEFQNSSSRKL